MYQCPICLERKRNIKSYFRHFQIHTNNSKFECNVENCSRNFKNYSSFISHLRRIHGNLNVPSALPIVGDDRTIECSVTLCQKKVNSLKELTKHYRDEHLIHGVAVNCPFIKCKSKIKTSGALSVHLSRYHRNDESHVDSYSVQNISAASSSLIQDEIIDKTSNNNAHEISYMAQGENAFDNYNENDIEKWGHDSFLQNLALFYLKLQSKYLVPSSTIQFIAEELSNFTNIQKDIFLYNIKEKLQSYNLEESVISDICEDFTNSDFLTEYHKKGHLRSAYCRNLFFKEKFNYIEPVEVYLGLDKNNKKCTFFYVPILETLKSMLIDNSVSEFCKKDYKTYNETIFSDYTDGTVFRKNALLQKCPHFLHIILYQDAFEIVNPLGSSKTKYKVIVFYLILGNIPSYCRFKIEPMKLVLLCYEKDLKYFSMHKVCAQLLHDLKILEEGTIIGETNYKGSLLYILGDNLGSHAIGGFSENFSTGKYFCRYCLISKQKWNKSLNHKAPNRTILNYTRDINYVNQNECTERHGIKVNSPFNDLQYFHVCNPGLPPCIGHDLFEGVVQYDLGLYLNYVVNDIKWLSVETLNRKILSFKYLGNDALDKPPVVNLTKKKNLQDMQFRTGVF